MLRGGQYSGNVFTLFSVLFPLFGSVPLDNEKKNELQIIKTVCVSKQMGKPALSFLQVSTLLPAPALPISALQCWVSLSASMLAQQAGGSDLGGLASRRPA